MIALSFMWLIGLLLLLSVIFFARRKWKITTALLICILYLNWWAECIPFRFRSLSDEKKSRIIKVMSFNIDGSSDDIDSKVYRIVSLIENCSPDVVFIAEYCEHDIKAIDTLLRKKFPESTLNKKGYFHYFYSKYPLVENRRLMDSVNKKGIGVYSTKIVKNGDTIALYGCHLPSNNYTADMKCFSPDSIGTGDDILQYFQNISDAHVKRGLQVDALVNDMKGCSYPVIVMGDMNDVGGSAAIRIMEKSGLRDAWWEGGCGYGATIHKPLPYRIDHILFSEGLKLMKIKVVNSEGLSDHDALYAEFEIVISHGFNRSHIYK